MRLVVGGGVRLPPPPSSDGTEKDVLFPKRRSDFYRQQQLYHRAIRLHRAFRAAVWLRGVVLVRRPVVHSSPPPPPPPPLLLTHTSPLLKRSIVRRVTRSTLHSRCTAPPMS